MKTGNLFLFIICLTLAVACGKKSETDSVEISKDQNDEKFDSTDLEYDTKFAVKAVDGGVLEVKLGELAQSNATNAIVKKLGQQMIDDHGKANSELKALANQKNISTPGTLSDDHQKKYDDLAKKAGSEFDKAYCEFMVKAHKENIDIFENEADNGKDADIRTWATQKLPALKHHLQMAEEAENLVNK